MLSNHVARRHCPLPRPSIFARQNARRRCLAHRVRAQRGLASLRDARARARDVGHPQHVDAQPLEHHEVGRVARPLHGARRAGDRPAPQGPRPLAGPGPPLHAASDGGRRRRQDGRALAAAEGPHPPPRPGRRRRGRQPARGAAAVPGEQRPGEGHHAVHQFARRFGLGRHGHLRHHAVCALRHEHRLLWHCGVDGRLPAGGGHQGQAPQPAQLAHHDPPAPRRRAGPGG
mmetsp:Transcript_63293/g.168547  ORF Transcript_63293/g.168547 Transcript_63293/m.168547 type:complete len:230 (+) Transcript_63293:406-1095(+)